MHSLDQCFDVLMPVRLRYRIYLPDAYDGVTAFPMLMFLHGAGARGSDFRRVEALGLPQILEAAANLPLIVVAPQCPRNLDWSMILPALNTFVDKLTAKFRIDPERLYLTGLSMGGFGVWSLATEYPARFAAIAPVCGGARPLLDFPERLERIVHLPVWCFHGDRDEEIAIQQSHRLVSALHAYGGNVTFTIYEGAGHDSWTATYANPELYSWFLRHKRQFPCKPIP